MWRWHGNDGAKEPGTMRENGNTVTRPVAGERAAPRQALAAGGQRRGVAARSIGAFVPRLTKPAFEKFGFSAATLITDWATIVGPDFARYTAPERLKWPRRVEMAPDEVGGGAGTRTGATLTLAVEAGRALDVQYKAQLVIERINAYFGYRAVSELRLLQVADIGRRDGAMASPSAQLAREPLPREVIGRELPVAGVEDEALRAALERMAAGLVSRKVRPGATA
jgi:hypothetical protein